MRQKFPGDRSNPAIKNRLLSSLFRHLPGAWVDPKHNELISLYRLRYRMALEEEKYDTAMIFLNKIIELDPHDVEAKLAKAEIYHHGLRDYPKAIEQYNRVIKLTNEKESAKIHNRARAAMAEIMEMLS
jgi:tetratricopeptide (TPR) repeat protein